MRYVAAFLSALWLWSTAPAAPVAPAALKASAVATSASSAAPAERRAVAWDGRDERGHGVPRASISSASKPLANGERELLELPVRVGAESFTLRHRGTQEVGRVEVRFAPAPPPPNVMHATKHLP